MGPLVLPAETVPSVPGGLLEGVPFCPLGGTLGVVPWTRSPGGGASKGVT